MNNQHFIFKNKDKYLPFIITKSIKNKIIKRDLLDVFYIDKKYLRKLKILNIEDKNSDDDKILLEYLINDSFVDMFSEEKYNNYIKNFSTSGNSQQGSQGLQGLQGVSGAQGVSGVQGATYA